MPLKSKTRRTYRQKTERKEWAAVQLEKIDSNLWNLGVSICKSKRAQNDWFRGKRNRRSKRVQVKKIRRHIHALTIMSKLAEVAIKEIPPADHVVVYTTLTKPLSIAKYAERLGFTFQPQGTQLFWVLTSQQSREALHQIEHTNALDN